VRYTREERRQKLTELYGAQMAGLLYYIKNLPNAPLHIRLRAEELQQKWDTVSDLRLMNPFTATALEKELRK
jgi:hypothetical protein